MCCKGERRQWRIQRTEAGAAVAECEGLLLPKHDAGTATRHWRAFWQRRCCAAAAGTPLMPVRRKLCGVAIIKRKAAHLLFGALYKKGAGTPRIVTVGLRPNVPQSGAPAFWGAASEWDRHAAHRHGCPTAKCSSERRTCLLGHCIRMGQACCASSRLACGQMLLRAAHLPFWGAA